MNQCDGLMLMGTALVAGFGMGFMLANFIAIRRLEKIIEARDE